ncbi:MAG: diguanylate cyclase [Clostridiales bacterium]|nr:diguanylate cyclase [Clostridiales bacterium]
MMQFLHNGYRLEETHPDYRKTYLLNITFLIFIATCLSFAVLNLFVVECLENPLFLVGSSAFCLFTLYYFHRTDNVQRSAILLVWILAFTLLIYFHAVQNQHFGLYWMVAFPPITYFLLGVRKAQIASILFFSYILFFILTNRSQWSPAVFNSQSVLNIAGSTLGLLLLVSYHERSRKEAADALIQTNSTLHESKEDLQLILDTAGEGIFGLDTQGIFTFCNTRGLELLGYSGEEELIGKPFLMSAQSSAETDYSSSWEECRIFRTIKNSEKVYSDHESFRKADGSFMEVEYYSCPKHKGDQIAGAVVTFNDISERKRNEYRIAYLSRHDHLTGLINRQQLDRELIACDRLEFLPLSVVYADLDGLKFTNDIFGHDAGDEFLRKAANILTLCSEEKDILARIGGDEFVWIMPQTDPAAAKDRMRSAKDRLEAEETMIIKATISMGCCTKLHAHEDLIQVYRNAENIMYQNKTARKKGYEQATLKNMTELLWERSSRTRDHATNTAFFCERMGEALNWPAAETKKLKDAGYYHDIGEIVLEPSLLNKTGTLTSTEEYTKQQHPIIGYRIMNLFDHTLDLADAVYSHHEKWDGSGYPRGLKGVEIPIQSRIIALAEQYDDILHGPAGLMLNAEEAIRRLQSMSGTHFDPDLVPIFVKAAAACRSAYS